MKKYITLVILTLILISMTSIETQSEISSQVRPYIKNEILYIRKKEIPVKYITHFELVVNEFHKYGIIEYYYTKTDGGIMTLNYREFKKLERYFKRNPKFRSLTK